MSAANEVAVGMFLRHELGYNRIYDAAAGAIRRFEPLRLYLSAAFSAEPLDEEY